MQYLGDLRRLRTAKRTCVNNLMDPLASSQFDLLRGAKPIWQFRRPASPSDSQ